MIGVLLGVESSKQPWSTAAGRARDASSLALSPSCGQHPRQKEPAVGRQTTRGPPRKANASGRPLEPLGENC